MLKTDHFLGRKAWAPTVGSLSFLHIFRSTFGTLIWGPWNGSHPDEWRRLQTHPYREIFSSAPVTTKTLYTANVGFNMHTTCTYATWLVNTMVHPIPRSHVTTSTLACVTKKGKGNVGTYDQ